MKHNKGIGLFVMCLMLVCISIDTKVNAETFNLDINEDNSIDVLDVITLKNRIVSNNDIGTYTNLLFLKKYILELSTNVVEHTLVEGVSSEPPQTTKATTTTTTIIETEPPQTEPPQTEPPATEPPTPSYPWDNLTYDDFSPYMYFGLQYRPSIKETWLVRDALERWYNTQYWDTLNNLDNYNDYIQAAVNLGGTDYDLAVFLCTAGGSLYMDESYLDGTEHQYNGSETTFESVLTGGGGDCGTYSVGYLIKVRYLIEQGQAPGNHSYRTYLCTSREADHAFSVIEVDGCIYFTEGTIWPDTYEEIVEMYPDLEWHELT